MPLERRTTLGRSVAETSYPGVGEDADKAAPLRTKMTHRESTPRATHSPERLREFMLPAMVIRSLSLDAALQKLMEAYQVACMKSGETPLPLTFAIPAEASRKLTLHLPAGNFNTSVQLLATLSGMKASRQNREYRFELMGGERKDVKLDLTASLRLTEVLCEMTGEAIPDPSDPFAPAEPAARKPIRDYLTTLGIELDPSTQVSLGASGKLTLETTDPADAAAVAALVKAIGEVHSAQLKFTTKILELPSGTDWTPPDLSDLGEEQLQALMREMAQKKGVGLTTTPSVTARNGQGTTIENIRELISPADDSGEVFEKHDIGLVMKAKASKLGFGQEVDFKMTDTTGALDPTTGRAVINRRTNITDSGFSQDGGTRFVRQIREDGTQTLLLVTSEEIDSTGRPVR